MPEAVIRKCMRHSQNSKVLARYQHLVSEDQERELAELAGLGKQTGAAIKDYKAKTCPKCGQYCTPTEVICACGNVLNSGAILQQETEAEVLQKRLERLEIVAAQIEQDSKLRRGLDRSFKKAAVSSSAARCSVTNTLPCGKDNKVDNTV